MRFSTTYRMPTRCTRIIPSWISGLHVDVKIWLAGVGCVVCDRKSHIHEAEPSRRFCSPWPVPHFHSISLVTAKTACPDRHDLDRELAFAEKHPDQLEVLNWVLLGQPRSPLDEPADRRKALVESLPTWMVGLLNMDMMSPTNH